MIIGINALTHTVKKPPPFLLSLSLTAQTAPTFFTLIQTQTHSSSEKDTNRSCSLFSLNVQSHNFHLFSINKSQIQHFIQQMQNNNPTPQIKQLQQFTQQFHMAKIYNNNDHSILRHITIMTGWTGYPSVLDRVDWLPLGTQ